MGRQFRDKVAVGWRIQRLKNGDVYILERTTKYDPTTKKPEAGKIRWSTESIRRDQLFLERLGIVKPAVQAAMAPGAAAGAAQ